MKAKICMLCFMLFLYSCKNIFIDDEFSIKCVPYTGSELQALGFSQSYNRYSYCLNNPLRYTDPSGEKWYHWALLAFGFLDPVSASVTAATAVATTAGITLPIAATTYTTTFTITPFLFFGGAIDRDWARGRQLVANAWKITEGLFVTDPNKDFLGQSGEFFSRFSWELVQTSAGYFYTQGRNAIGNVDRVDYLGGATFATRENAGYRDGVTMGNFININIGDAITGDFRDRVISDPLFMHEHGHTRDSRIFGPIYLIAIGIPSISSAYKNQTITAPPFNTHRGFWTEKRANRHAKRYFGKYYGVDWNGRSPFYTNWRDIFDDDGNFIERYFYTIEDYYPTK